MITRVIRPDRLERPLVEQPPPRLSYAEPSVQRAGKSSWARRVQKPPARLCLEQEPQPVSDGVALIGADSSRRIHPTQRGL
jgi:hypothetical protein